MPPDDTLEVYLASPVGMEAGRTVHVDLEGVALPL